MTSIDSTQVDSTTFNLPLARPLRKDPNRLGIPMAKITTTADVPSSPDTSVGDKGG
jgi:hypothetical protein